MSDDEEFPAVDPEAVARAEAIVESMRGRFLDWLLTSRDAMAENHAVLMSNGEDRAKRLGAIMVTAHEMKGMGGTFGYPVVTRLGRSFEQYLLDCEPEWDVDLSIVDDHIGVVSKMLTAFETVLDPKAERELNTLVDQLEARCGQS